jgi:hypothetical protein
LVNLSVDTIILQFNLKVRYEGVKYISLVHDEDQRRAVVNISFRKSKAFFDNLFNISFARMILRH